MRLEQLSILFDHASLVLLLQENIQNQLKHAVSNARTDFATQKLQELNVKDIVIKDYDVLKILLPPDLFEEIMHHDYLDLFHITFCLRHIYSQIILATHFSHVFNDKNHFQNNEWYKIATFFKWENVEENSHIMVSLIQLLSSHNLYPFISALGLHLLYIPEGMCKAWKPGLKDLCHNPPENKHFCKQHKQHAWWNKQYSHKHINRFYALWSNIYTYKEEDLLQQIGVFWHSYKKWCFTDKQTNLDTYSKVLGFNDFKALKKAGTMQLKKAFLEYASELHPDHGGDHNDFILLKKAYDCLQLAMQ